MVFKTEEAETRNPSNGGEGGKLLVRPEKVFGNKKKSGRKGKDW